MLDERGGTSRERVARSLFGLSLVILVFGFGVITGMQHWFPVAQIRGAKKTSEDLLLSFGIRRPFFMQQSNETQPIRIIAETEMSPGLTLVSGISADWSTFVNVIDSQRRLVHSWRITWNNLWPNPTHLEEGELPKSNPALVQGMVLMADGDLVFSFEGRGLVRMNACGEVVWRLPYRTHHSVYLDDRGNLWVPGQVRRRTTNVALPNYRPPYWDFTVLEVSPDGRILQEISVLDVIVENGLRGLLHMLGEGSSTVVSGDTLHLNDVEVFPRSLPAGVFKPGDVMVSLRNISAILVFEPDTRHITFMSVGRVLRQHDPDFVDGNTISVLDNNALGGPTSPPGYYSRIVTLSAVDHKQMRVRFAGTSEQPFYTEFMGTHENLPNGNMLIVESTWGRVIEVDSRGRIVWQFVNIVRDGVVALMSDAVRLPPEIGGSFFGGAKSACHLDTRARLGQGTLAKNTRRGEGGKGYDH